MSTEELRQHWQAAFPDIDMDGTQSLNQSLRPRDRSLDFSDTISGSGTFDGTFDSSPTEAPQQTEAEDPVSLDQTSPAKPGCSGFQSLEEIGRGGMGVVYRARQEALKRLVAIKKLSQRRSAEAAGRASTKFLSEAYVTAVLDHPNIVPVYELAESGAGELELAMKLVTGQSWRERIRQDHAKGPLSPELFDQHVAILSQVCNAVAFAHSRGFLHLDIKPENVMLGAFGEVLLMDWGLAVHIEDEPDERLTISKNSLNQPCGTPSYMAPELAEGQGRDWGPWTDVYLLTAALFEVLTGRAPHQGSSVFQVLLAASRGQIADLPDSAQGLLSKDLREFLNKGLAADRAERFQSVEDFQGTLSEISKHGRSRALTEQAEAMHASVLEDIEAPGPVSEAFKVHIYGSLKRTMERYEQALLLWPENQPAVQGLSAFRSVIGLTAVRFEDLTLAETQLKSFESGTAAHEQLSAAILEVRERRLQVARSARRYRGFFAAAVLLLVGGLLAGLLVVQGKNRRLDQALQTAENKRREAETAKTAADKARLDAERAREGATAARLKTDEALKRAQSLLADLFLEKGKGRLKQKNWGQAQRHFLQSLLYQDRFETRAFFLQSKKNRGRMVSQPVTPTRMLTRSPLRLMPSGSVLVWGNGSRRLQFYDLKTEDFVHKTPVHLSQTDVFAVHPKTNELALAVKDQGLRRLVDFGRQLKQSLGEAKNRVYDVKYSPSGDSLATVSRDRVVRLYRAADGELLAQASGFGRSWVSRLEFSPDGSMLMAYDGLRLHVYALPALSKRFVLKGHKYSIVDWFCHPKRPQLVTASGDKTMRIFDLETGKSLRILRGHKSGLRFVRLHPRGHLLASGSEDGKILLWPIDKRRPSFELQAHRSGIKALEFLSDGRLISGDESGRLILWDTDKGEIWGELKPHADAVVAVKVLGGGRFASLSERDCVRIWDVQARTDTLEWVGQKHRQAVLLPMTGSRVLVGEEQQLQVWDLKDNSKRRLAMPESGPIYRSAVGPKGMRVASQVNNYTIAVWDMAAQKKTELVRADQGALHLGLNQSNMLFLSESRLLVRYEDHQVWLWDLKTQEAVSKLSLAKGCRAWFLDRERQCVYLSFDNERPIFSLSLNSKNQLELAETGLGLSFPCQYLPESQAFVDISSRGVSLCGLDGSVRSLVKLGGIQSAILTVGGRWLFVSRMDKGRFVFELHDCEAQRVMMRWPLPHSIFCMFWSEDGRRLVFQDSKNRVRAWTLESILDLAQSTPENLARGYEQEHAGRLIRPN